MKITRKRILDALWLLAIALILLTPLGFHVRVYLTRLISFPPKIETPAVVDEVDYSWNLTDIEGKTVDFKVYEGKVVVLNFWATWCPPCVAEMPSFQKLYDDYGEGVDFLFVTNEGHRKVSKFMEKKGYRFPMYFSYGKPPDGLVSSSIPATYILNRSGNIVVSKIGAANWNSQSVRNLLDTLLKE